VAKGRRHVPELHPAFSRTTAPLGAVHGSRKLGQSSNEVAPQTDETYFRGRDLVSAVRLWKVRQHKGRTPAVSFPCIPFFPSGLSPCARLAASSSPRPSTARSYRAIDVAEGAEYNQARRAKLWSF
jgi:hypothetical protein